MGRRNLDDRKVVKEGIKKKEEGGKKKYRLRDKTTTSPTCAGKHHKFPGTAVPFSNYPRISM